MIELKINEKFSVTETETLLVTENYMEEVLISEKLIMTDEDGIVSSVDVVEQAVELGFINLGDFGEGFVFAVPLSNMLSNQERIYNIYFTNNYLYREDSIVINGKELNVEQATMLIEAINGNIEFGVQCSGFLEDGCGIDASRQSELLNEIDTLFIK